jgi:hypothetical protein
MVRITKLVFNLSHEEVLLVKRFFRIVFALLKANGTKFTINYLKQSRLLITRYICKKRIYRNDHFISSKRGFPTKFSFLKEFIDSGNINKVKFVLTLMNISRAIELRKNDKVTIDTSSITNPFPRKSIYTIPGWFINDWITNNNLKLVPHKYTTKDFFISLKQGPHGPTILSMLETIKWVSHQQLVSMKILIDDDEFFVKYIGKLYSFMKHNLFRIPRGSAIFDIDKKIENYPQITGRIAVVKDPEYKMRLIAISDYFTQFILKPIHTQLLQLLKSLECDRTFTQDPFHKWVGDGKFHSLDLSSATDRFPILLQEKLFQYLYVPTKVHKLIGSYWFAKAWKDLISQRDYLCDGKLIRYSVGQPMGSYSSWAAFTLTHHLVVAWAAFHVYGKGVKFTNYIILGDDIVIKDDKVAKKYVDVMKKLGVAISPHKTHVSKDTYEFAKRWIRYKDEKFIEFSPLPVKGIALNIKNPFIVFTILFDYFIIKGNLCLIRGSISHLVGKLYLGIKFNEPKGKILYFRIPYLVKRLQFLNFGMRYSLGINNYDSTRNFICRHSYNNDWYQIPDLSTIPFEMNRVLDRSVKGLVKEGINSTSKLHEQFKRYFALCGLEDWNIIGSFPMFYAIKHYVERLLEIQSSWTEENFSLYEISKEVSFLDFSEFALWNRNYHDSILNGSKLWSKAFQFLNETDDKQIDYLNLQTVKISLSPGLKRFIDQFGPIEHGKFTNLHPKMLEGYRTMAKRHGYAFLK